MLVFLGSIHGLNVSRNIAEYGSLYQSWTVLGKRECLKVSLNVLSW